MIGKFFDIIFPKFCLSCHKEGFYICPECFNKIPLNKSQRCAICQTRRVNADICLHCKRKNYLALNKILIASDWNNLLVRQLIYELKYRFIKEIAERLGELLVFCLRPFIYKDQQYLLIPVPPHKKRLDWRGFNQAELLAKKISESLKIPINHQILIRQKNTESQMEINDVFLRKKNVSGAFKLINSQGKNADAKTNNLIRNKIIILIDDICTTASTLNECALALKPEKPKEIWALVVAQG